MFRSKHLHKMLGFITVSSLVLAAFVMPGSVAAQTSPAQPLRTVTHALQAQGSQPIVGYDYNHMTTAALRDIPPVAPNQKETAPQNAVIPLLKLPTRDTPARPDTATQDTPAAPNMPAPMLNFDGIPFPGVNCNCAPPDTNGEVGLTQYVQIVNEGLQVFDKTTGASQLGPIAISSLWSGFGGACEFNGFGDPVVLYDQLANRWVVTQFASASGGIPITDECIAVSTSSDATGSYNLYGFHLGEDFFDYPKFGVWPDAYYMGMNVFNSSGTAFLGPQPFAFDRPAMLAGNPATFVTFRDPAFFNPSSDQFMPADLDGLIPPPAGSPNPFVSTGVNATWPLHRFHVDFATPANSTFTLDGTLTPTPFTVLFSLVPQFQGDGLDSLADRGMFRSAYRHFSDGHEALVGNMTVSSGGVAGIRWFEINNATSGTPSFVQESTYQPDSTWRWMGSAAMDGNGNLAVGFSASDATIHPQIRYAGRLATDPPNTLAQGEAHLFDGAGSQLDTVSRWGDYSDLTVDPVDDCTFWYTQEYYETNSSFNWRTRIGNFVFPTCTTAPSGTLQGTVTDTSTLLPIAGAQINVSPLGASTVTDASGNYSLVLPVGTYDVTASAFGYTTPPAVSVVITDGGITVRDFQLAPAPSHSVSGIVSDNFSNPIEGATVTILGTPIPPATTDAAGSYSFASVPEGTYNVMAAAGGCNDSQTQQLVVDGDETLNFTLPARHDNFGYFCQVVTPSYVEGTTQLALSGDDNVVQVNLPFGFSFYGQTYNTSFVTTNGFLNFLAPNATFSNSAIPSSFAPNGAIYPYWDDLFVDSPTATMWTAELQNPHRFLIEWRNVAYFADFSRRVDFEAILYETGQILTQYRNIAADGREQGNSATIGIENAAGDDALQYSFNTASIGSPDFAVRYSLPPSGFIQGTVTDANDTLPIAGASVLALQGGNTIRSTTTDANGFYRMQVPVGDYTVEASATNYVTGSAQVSVAEDQTVVQDFALGTARAEVNPTSFVFIVPAGQQRTKILNLSNTGGVTMTWEIKETGGGAVRPTTSREGLERNPDYDPNSRTTEGLYLNPPPKDVSSTMPGDVLASWVPAGFSLPWGVGFNGNVWLSDPLAGGNLCAFVGTCHNAEFTVAGVPTGRDNPADWAGAWNADMALDTMHNAMCQVNVGGDNGIYCWDLNTGNIVGSITSGPWTGISQRGLAYRPDDNSFYIGGWNQGILYHIQGLGSPSPGAVISQCSTPDPNISGLTWNSAFNIIWEATNSPSDTIYELNPDTCAVLNSIPHPTPGFAGGGLEMNDEGNLWTISQADIHAYLLESGVPAFVNVPWLTEIPSSGTLDAGGTQAIQIKVDATGLATGVYSASMFVQSNSGRQPSIRVPVTLIVPAYFQGVNAGGSAYTDLSGDTWAADRAWVAGSYGYIGQSSAMRTNRPIAGTLDDPLYRDLRVRMVEYRFDGLPNGVYEVDLRFAEITRTNPGRHLFDVIIEGNTVLPAHDIAAEVGSFAADDHVFFVVVTDGQLNIRFIRRTGFGDPIVNAIQVVHRPDQ